VNGTLTAAPRRGFAVPPRFSGLLVIRRHVDLLRVNSALCSFSK
jgi:hypothetical protein